MAAVVEDRRAQASFAEAAEASSEAAARHFASLPTVLPPQPRNLDGINLLLSVEQQSPNEITQRKLQVFAGETIRDLKIHLRKKEFFTNKHCLVFGHRELLENETLGQLAAESGGGNYLHVMAKLSDVERLEVTTDKRFVKKDNERISALTAHFRQHGVTPQANAGSSPLLLRGSVMENDKVLTIPSKETREREPVVHLIIRKSSKVHWHHLRGEKFELRISANDTVEEVKRKLEEVADGFEANEHALVKAGHTLQPGMSLSELGVQRGDVLEIVEVPLCLEEYREPTSPLMMTPTTEMSMEWSKAKDALARGVRPKLASQGTGGSYFISALEGMNLAIFKPEDEEPRAPNNPKGHKGSPTGDGLRKGIRPGEGATREVIAFTLDHGHFSGVPPTTMATLSDCQSPKGHRKVGSFQRFVQHDVDCEEMGPSNFPIHEVHKISVLDIRLANTDRNGGNILASRKDGRWVLTPIDHGYCLPDSFEDISFEWMYWPQAKAPFADETLHYIQALDVDHDLELLNKAGLYIRPECVRVFRVCTMLLKKASARGLTPHQIGLIMCRQSFTMSPLEKLHKSAVKMTLAQMYGSGNATSGQERLRIDDALYLKTVSTAIDQYLEETQEAEDEEEALVF